MANTYTLIEAKTLGSSTASITFSSIPATYTDLKLVVSARSDSAGLGDVMKISFNASSSNFTNLYLQGDGSAASTGTFAQLAGQSTGGGSTADTFSSQEIYIPNYTSSNYKSFSIDSVIETNAATGVANNLTAGLWSNTAAITSITLTPNVGPNLVQYSTFYLYGISNS
jgi:hypothetical protein